MCTDSLPAIADKLHSSIDVTLLQLHLNFIAALSRLYCSFTVALSIVAYALPLGCFWAVSGMLLTFLPLQNKFPGSCHEDRYLDNEY